LNRVIGKTELGAFAFLGALTIGCLLAAFQTELKYLALIPFGVMIVYAGIINFRVLYYMLLFALPLSIEFSFSDSLGTDLPDEPMMIGLMVVTVGYLLTNYKALPTGYFAHIIIIGLLAHWFWIFLAALHSVNFLVSFKVFLAKTWYITTFSILSAVIIRNKDDLKKAFWCIFIPLTLLTAQVIVRHGLLGFSFEDVNKPMAPFFRNHVNYAAILSIFFPFILLARTWYARGSYTRWLLNFSLLFYVVAIYLSYTRTCYLALVLIVPFFFIIRHRLMKPFLLVAIVGAGFFINHLFQQNYYLRYAPEYLETIYHDDFSQHIASTFEGKDVSSMERVYRWVAAVHMFKDHPYMGFGPGNFYPYYMHYTVLSFETYVSDNPERSTAHNYALFLLTEQGAIGLGIFLLLTIIILVKGENIYHRMGDGENKEIVLFFLVTIMVVYVNLMLSDLLESDKVGPFFFMCLSLLAAWDIRHRKLPKPKG
jgi:O-antigen ligase